MASRREDNQAAYGARGSKRQATDRPQGRSMLPDGGNLYLQVSRTGCNPTASIAAGCFDTSWTAAATTSASVLRTRSILPMRAREGEDAAATAARRRRSISSQATAQARPAGRARGRAARHDISRNARKPASPRTRTVGRTPSTAPSGRKACRNTPTRCSAISPLTT